MECSKIAAQPFRVIPLDPRERDLLDVPEILQGTDSKWRALGDRLVLVEPHDGLGAGVFACVTDTSDRGRETLQRQHLGQPD